MAGSYCRLNLQKPINQTHRVLFSGLTIACDSKQLSALALIHVIIGFYRRISEKTYQPKCVGQVVGFETLALCISLKSIQMCTYFCRGLVAGYCLYLEEIPFETVIRFLIDLVSHISLLWA